MIQKYMEYQFYHKKYKLVAIWLFSVLPIPLITYLSATGYMLPDDSMIFKVNSIILIVMLFIICMTWTSLFIVEIFMKLPYLSIYDDHINFRIGFLPVKGEDYYFKDVDSFELNFNQASKPELLIHIKDEYKEIYKSPNVFDRYFKLITFGCREYCYTLQFLDHDEFDIQKMLEESFTCYRKEHSTELI